MCLKCSQAIRAAGGCGATSSDQRVAIFVVLPEAHPPGASSRGNRPTLIRFIWEAPGARRRQKMASPRTVTIVALSFALGLFFVFMGTIKLTPRLSKDAYSEMVST